MVLREGYAEFGLETSSLGISIQAYRIADAPESMPDHLLSLFNSETPAHFRHSRRSCKYGKDLGRSTKGVECNHLA